MKNINLTLGFTPTIKKEFSSRRSKIDSEKERDIKSELKKQMPEGLLPSEYPVKLKITFSFLLLKKFSKKTKENVANGEIIYNASLPDLLDLTDIIVKDLKGLAYYVPAQVSHIETLKVYGTEEKTTIEIEVIDDNDENDEKMNITEHNTEIKQCPEGFNVKEAFSFLSHELKKEALLELSERTITNMNTVKSTWITRDCMPKKYNEIAYRVYKKYADKNIAFLNSLI